MTTAHTKTVLLGLAGAALAGTLGYFAFFWMFRQGFFSPTLPGAFLGLGAGLCVRQRSNLLGGICGVASIGLGLFTQWRFAGSEGFADYLMHVFSEPPVTLIMIALGGFFGYRFALGWGKKPSATAAETAKQ